MRHSHSRCRSGTKGTAQGRLVPEPVCNQETPRRNPLKRNSLAGPDLAPGHAQTCPPGFTRFTELSGPGPSGTRRLVLDSGARSCAFRGLRSPGHYRNPGSLLELDALSPRLSRRGHGQRGSGNWEFQGSLGRVDSFTNSKPMVRPKQGQSGTHPWAGASRQLIWTIVPHASALPSGAEARKHLGG